MGFKTGFNYANPVELVNRYIGTSYDIVKEVHDNLSKIVIVSDNIDNVNIVANNIVNVGIVADDISNVNIVAVDIDSVNTVADNIADILSVANDIDKVVIVADNIDDIVYLADNLDDIQGDIAQLKLDVISLQSDVSAIVIDVTQLQTDVSTLQSDVSTISTDLTNLTSDVVDNTSDIAALDTRVGNNETNIGTNTSDIATNASDISTLQTDVTNLDTRVTTLEEKPSGGASFPIGSSIQYAGDLAAVNAEFDGTWADHEYTAVYDGATYPDLVALNKDPDILFNELNIESFEVYNQPIDGGYVENVKYWDDQLYYTHKDMQSKEDIVYIRSTATSRTSIGEVDTTERFFVTPGIETDDGNGTYYESLSNVYTSPFEIKGIKLRDGTVVDGFVSVVGASLTSGAHWCTKVKRTDLFADDMSDWVNTTGEASYRCERNSNEEGIQRRIINVIFQEDCFYVVYDFANGTGGINVDQLSYDFSGEFGYVYGTDFRPINYDINDGYEKGLYFAVGNETKDFYQYDTVGKSLYINEQWVASFDFGDTKDIDGVPFNLVVQEKNGDIFASVSAKYTFLGAQENMAQAFLYYDSSSGYWNNFRIPFPSAITHIEGASMMLNKFDFDTGIVVASLSNESGDGSGNYFSLEEVKFVISRDYGMTWTDDTGITCSSLGSAPDVANNTMDILNIHSYNYMGFDSGNNWRYDNMVSAKQPVFASGAVPFKVHSNTHVITISGITLPVNTATYERFKSLSNKLKTYYRIL